MEPNSFLMNITTLLLMITYMCVCSTPPYTRFKEFIVLYNLFRIFHGCFVSMLRIGIFISNFRP